MADLINLAAESDRNIIGDDSSPSLTLENTSSGNVLKLQNAGGTGISLAAVSCPTTSVQVVGAAKAIEFQGSVAGTIKSAASAVNALELSHSVIGSPTVAPVAVLQSAASGAFMEFKGAFMSTASINIAANKTVFVIPVYHGSKKIQGYIPVFLGVS